MKRSFFLFAIILGFASLSQAAEPGVLTTLKSIHALTNEQASHALRVEFKATVTFFRGFEAVLFVQDDGLAIYVQTPTGLNLLPGDCVLVKGKTHGSYRPEVDRKSTRLNSSHLGI